MHFKLESTFSLSRWIGIKAKELKNRLGDPKNLPDTEQVKAEIAKNMTQILELHIKEIHQKIDRKKEPLLRTRRAMRDHHRKYRALLRQKQEERWNRETIERSKRLPRGLKAIWFRLTGRYQKIRRLNESETEKCRFRDQQEMQTLRERQFKERRKLQEYFRHGFKEYNMELFELRQDISRYMGISRDFQIQQEKLRTDRGRRNRSEDLER